MSKRSWIVIVLAVALAVLPGACSSPNPQPPGLTPIPTLAPGATPTLVAALQAPAVESGTELSAETGQPDPALGAIIYLQHCSPCHGDQGQGVIGPALRNSQYIQTSDDQTLFATIASGRTTVGMPAWLLANGGPLTTAQVGHTIAYVRSLQNVSPLPQATLQPTETPAPGPTPVPEAAQPSNPGGPGPAMALTGDAAQGTGMFGLYCSSCHGPEGVIGLPNPDSDDGAVPALNPIDPTIANPDPKVFATNVDLFVEHGSVPAGPGPQIVMPSFGDGKLLDPQKIADIIAYVLQLNAAQ